MAFPNFQARLKSIDYDDFLPLLKFFSFFFPIKVETKYLGIFCLGFFPHTWLRIKSSKIMLSTKGNLTSENLF